MGVRQLIGEKADGSSITITAQSADLYYDVTAIKSAVDTITNAVDTYLITGVSGKLKEAATVGETAQVIKGVSMAPQIEELADVVNKDATGFNSVLEEVPAKAQDLHDKKQEELNSLAAQEFNSKAAVCFVDHYV